MLVYSSRRNVCRRSVVDEMSVDEFSWTHVYQRVGQLLLWSQRRNKVVHEGRNLDPIFSPGRVEPRTLAVPRQFVYGLFVYDTSSTAFSSSAISSTDISSATVYQRVGQLYIQLMFQQIIIFINSNFYLHYDSFLSISFPLTL